MKTYTPKANDISREWHVIDAKDKVLGRLSSEIAQLLIGKNKPYFTAHLDCGDYVVITNASGVQVTGDKLVQKKYYRHSGFPGGLKQDSLARKLDKDATKVIELAVKGMLPKNKLRDQRMKRLKVFVNDQHPYADKLKASNQSE